MKKLFTQTIADQIPQGLDRYDQIFAAKKLILATDSPLLATCRETLEEIEDIIFLREETEEEDIIFLNQI